jgi:cytochrome c556
MTMTERQEKRTLERKEIAARVAIFKATQEKFQKDREKYYAATMEAARAVKKNESSGGTSRR